MDIVIYLCCFPLATLVLAFSAILVVMATYNTRILRHGDTIACISIIVMFLSIVIGIGLTGDGEKITIHLTTAAEKRQAIHETYRSLVETEKVEQVSNAED